MQIISDGAKRVKSKDLQLFYRKLHNRKQSVDGKQKIGLVGNLDFNVTK